jgi:hypothetical protein
MVGGLGLIAGWLGLFFHFASLAVLAQATESAGFRVFAAD